MYFSFNNQFQKHIWSVPVLAFYVVCVCVFLSNHVAVQLFYAEGLLKSVEESLLHMAKQSGKADESAVCLS